MKQYQKGEAVTVVIIILVCTLLGALGFVAWQNFVKEDDTAKTETTQQEVPMDGEKLADQQRQENAIVFPDWGVEMVLSKDVYGLTATKSEYGNYTIAIPNAILFSDVNRGSGTQEIGYIARYIVNEKDDHTGETWGQLAGRSIPGIVVAGDYVYRFQFLHESPYALDNEAERAAQDKLTVIGEEIVAGLKTIRTTN